MTANDNDWLGPDEILAALWYAEALAVNLCAHDDARLYVAATQVIDGLYKGLARMGIDERTADDRTLELVNTGALPTWAKAGLMPGYGSRKPLGRPDHLRTVTGDPE